VLGLLLALSVGVARAGGPAPAGFEPLSVGAVSEGEYWVLGSVPCRRGRCSSLLHTRDGGGRGDADAAVCHPRDGFAFVSGVGGVFYVTDDGGASWRRLALGTLLAFATGRERLRGDGPLLVAALYGVPVRALARVQGRVDVEGAAVRPGRPDS
jgi:hypothetical protein